MSLDFTFVVLRVADIITVAVNEGLAHKGNLFDLRPNNED